MCEGGEDQTNERRETVFVWTHPITSASEVKTTFSAKCTTNGLLRKDCTVCELESKAAREATHRCRPSNRRRSQGSQQPLAHLEKPQSTENWIHLQSCSKEQRKKWKYHDGDTMCVCGLATENTAHLLHCSLLTRPCTLDDLLEFNDTGRECAERWKKTV